MNLETSIQTALRSGRTSTVSDDEFNDFHYIDRVVYTRLITTLNRDPKESMHVMAFWLWLEQDVVDDLTLVNKMQAMPRPLINELAEETVRCLRCVESETFPLPEAKPELLLLPSFVRRNISFKYFYDNRIWVLRGVTRVITEVCSRAFRDILESAIGGMMFLPSATPSRPVPAGENLTSSIGEALRNRPLLVPSYGGEVYSTYEVGSSSSSSSANSKGPLLLPPTMAPVAAANQLPSKGYLFPYPCYTGQHTLRSSGTPHKAAGMTVNKDVTDLVYDEFNHHFQSGLSLLEEDDAGEDDDASPDKRTIFLTFSKGYPISATEIKDFFTRRFGDFIEYIHMQEVGEDEQVLFARVVARSTSIVDVVVDGGRAKYIINGKHVWARKYVKKQKSPPRDGGAGSAPIHAISRSRPWY